MTHGQNPSVRTILSNPAPEGRRVMETRISVLGVLKKARERISTGASDGILPAISALREEASGPTRDQAYYAILDTIGLGQGDASITLLARPDSPEALVQVFDATIKRISAALH
jgi:hypothetical protein